MVGDAVRQVEDLLGDGPRPSGEEARQLFRDRVLPPSLAGLGPEAGDRLLQMVGELWADLDDCYEWDWGRPPRPAEKRWLCEAAVEALTGPPEDGGDEASE